MGIRRRLKSWLSWFPWYRRQARDADLARELRDHLELEAEEQRAVGLTPDEAAHAARRALGNELQVEEDVRAAWGFMWVETLLQDFRYGLRMLRKSPGFAAIAILTLALGLAANTAIFSIVNGVLLRPLEFPHPSQLVTVELAVPQFARKFPVIPPNPASYVAWAHQAKSLAGIAAVEVGGSLNLTGRGEPALMNADSVSANLLDVLGVRLLLGRNFSEDADQPGRNHEVILTNALWRNRFHSNPGIIGHAIALNRIPYSVVGVLPASFHFFQGNQLMSVMGPTPKPELFVPEVFGKSDLAADAGFGIAAIARLRPGVSRAQATAELNVILSRLFRSQSFPLPYPTAVVTPLHGMIVRSSERGLWMLLAAVLAVMLIICVNLASLILTRAAAGEQEAAIRSALGASRGRLLRQTLAETLLLGLAGGALGLVLARWALWALLAMAPAGLPRLHNVRLDGVVLVFTLGISVLAGVAAGLLGAWRMARANPQDALRSASTRSTDRGAGLRAREAMVGIETALGAMLLIAAGLFLTSFAKLERAPKGFTVEHIVTLNLQLPSAEYTRREQRSEFWRRLLVTTAALPAVESSAVTSRLPPGGEIDDDPVNLPGDTRPIAERPFASYRYVSPGYFRTLEIPLVRGRRLTWADADTGAVVISANAAETIWPGLDPIGQKFDGDPGVLHVVGVVGDTRSVTLSKGPTPMVYALYGGGMTGSLIFRTRMPGAAVALELRRAIWRVDSSVAVPPVRTMGQIVSSSLAPRRFEMLLTSVFAVAALLLACLGIYGVVSYSVARRTHEIGIRMALGAQKMDVLGRVVGQGMMPALLGLGTGILVSLTLVRLLSSLLYGIKPTDPLIFGAVAAILCAVTLLACYVPARRAMRVDPMAALRQE